MKTITSKFKIALVAVGLLTIGSMSAQTTDAASANVIKDTPADGAVVRVIDNKGTIKYFQSNNGITTITSTTAGSATTTTWQLGGTLTDDTYIDANGKVFALNGLKTATATGAAAAIVSESDGSGSTDGGWALLVRDETTGETKKLLATDLISGIRVEYPQLADATADVAITVNGLPALTAGTTDAKLFVYRNGAKLRTIVDFVATAGTVTIQYDATEMPMYAGDIIEIQYIK